MPLRYSQIKFPVPSDTWKSLWIDTDWKKKQWKQVNNENESDGEFKKEMNVAEVTENLVHNSCLRKNETIFLRLL